MATTFQVAGSLASSASASTLPVVAPTLAANDIMIACLINKALSNVISPPDTTWTLIVQDSTDCTNAVDDHRFAVYWKRVGPGDSGATFNFSKALDDNLLFAGVIGAFRGCAASGTPLDPTPVGITKTLGAVDTVSFPAFDPGGTDAHIVYLAFYGNDATTFAAAQSVDTNPDCTKRWDLETSAGTDCSIACTSGDTTNGASIASRTWASVSSVDAGSTGIVFALRTATANPTLTPSVGGGFLTGTQGVVVAATWLAPATGELACPGQAVTLGQSALIITPGAGTLYLAQQAGLTPGPAALAVVGQQCVLQPITTRTGAVSIFGTAPSLVATSPHPQPDVGLLALLGVAGTLAIDTPREPLMAALWFGEDEDEPVETYAFTSEGTLALIGAAPTVEIDTPGGETPTFGALLLAGTAPRAVSGALLRPASMLAEV